MIDVQVINNKPVVVEINANGSITSSGVQTVTGVYVNNDDPQNPVVNIAPLEDRVEDLEAILQSQSNFTGYAYAVWTGTGLIFDVFWPAYYIQGVRYDAGTGQVTLDPADPTNPRLDVIAVDATGAIHITGTAGVDPVKPTVDPLTQLEITTIFVAAGATTPTEITNETIYSENAEWTGTSNNGTVVFNSSADPFSGSVSVECDAFDDTHYIRFTDGVTHNKSDFSVLMFALKLKSLWSGGSIPTYIKLKFYNAGVVVSSTHAVTSGSHNFSRTETTDYQTIVVPISAFTFTNPLFDRVEFTFEGLNPDGFYLDQIVLQTGAATVSPLQNTLVSIETDSGVANVDTPDDTFQLLGANGITTSAVGKTITVRAKAIPYAALLGIYKIDTSGIVAPAGSGDIRYDNATQASATTLYVNHITDGGVDIDLFLSLLSSGTILVVQDKDSSDNYQIWEINGTPSFSTPTWTIPVVLNTSGGTGTTGFANNHEVFLASYGGGGGGGGHEILDEDGNPLAQEPQLQFVRLNVTADTGKTVVTRPADTFMGTTAPLNPVQGDIWTDTTETIWKTYVRYDGYWVERNLSGPSAGYELTSNKTNTVVGNETSSVKYLSVKGVYDWVTSYITSGASGVWLLASGGTLTGANTITSNEANQLRYNGTWTATANDQYHKQISPSLTARGTTSDRLYAVNIAPTLIAGANTQTTVALQLNPTFTNGAFTGVNNYALWIRSGRIAGPNDAAFIISATAPVQAAATVVGNAIQISASNATAGVSSGSAAGGAVTITAGNAAFVTGAASGGAVNITSGNGANDGTGGAINITAGNPGGGTPGAGGNITLTAGTWGGAYTGGSIVIGPGTTTSGGNITISGGSSTGSSPGGTLTLRGGSNTSSASGPVVIETQSSGQDGGTGSITVRTGSPVSGNISTSPSGAISISSGAGASSGAYSGSSGNISISIGAAGSRSASGAGTGSAAGTISISGGSGGNMASATNAITGGNGSSINITSGNGGNATGASGTRTGGNSGTITITTGAGGTGISAGSVGSIIFKVNSSSTAYEIGYNSSAVKIGWFGTTIVSQQSVNTILVNNVTSGGSLSTIADFTDLSVYSNDAATIRNNFFRLTEKVLKLETALRNYGLTID